MFSVASSFHFSNSFLSHSVFQCTVSFLLPCEGASCTSSIEVQLLSVAPLGCSGCISVPQEMDEDAINSPQPSLQWAGEAACTLLTTSVHYQASFTLTRVILSPSSLQNKRVGINLAAGRFLCILQSRLPQGTLKGCSKHWWGNQHYGLRQGL